ncbi:hypothetical protein IE53DRAFT_241871 [Violaceomyces palustris]|uniref:Uncharacterized protein n=1 Tax=Violaceomyces palustris TaxID=1673888 RepID=A0ACD0NP46_9BASI|nr:hypothetical protein IE53DRAFT_241871 [Violaceomyces palustris]
MVEDRSEERNPSFRFYFVGSCCSRLPSVEKGGLTIHPHLVRPRRNDGRPRTRPFHADGSEIGHSFSHFFSQIFSQPLAPTCSFLPFHRASGGGGGATDTRGEKRRVARITASVDRIPVQLHLRLHHHHHHLHHHHCRRYHILLSPPPALPPVTTALGWKNVLWSPCPDLFES